MTEDISKKLEEYKNFQECVLLDVRWYHYGTTVELTFDYVWDTDGKLRTKLNENEPIVVCMRLVQEFRLNNALNEAMVLQSEQINWGLNEVAAIRIVEDSELLDRYSKLPKDFHHMAVLWERGSSRRIDVIFSELEIRKGSRTVQKG